MNNQEKIVKIPQLIVYVYVAVGERIGEDFDFSEKLKELNMKARELEEIIAENVALLLEQR